RRTASAPPAKLSVSGSGPYNAVGAPRFDLFNTVFGDGFLQHVTDAGIWQIATTAGATRMVINSFGSVGIGTVTPGAQLTINGSGTNGFSLGVNGSAGQNLTGGGFVKAMVRVDPFLPADQYITDCWNSQANLAATNCSSSVTRQAPGSYTVNFGFPVDGRF